ncbi:hypothetical protein [Klebsiella quasipneumoniae]|uniref:hypothetical protein n=1 Tax=Klebsiella quasipneumoniae TaxID=1463165 RepID=UPI001E29301F|nr:hypothetical protein [Klebsiella quasipneumoniae]
MDKFDRNIQRELLQHLCDIYPDSADSSFSKAFSEKFGGMNTFTANILYLAGHGLIEVKLSNEIGRRLPYVIDHHEQRYRFYSRRRRFGRHPKRPDHQVSS